MKKFLIGLLIFFVLIIAALAILPSLYKEEIKAKIDQEVAKSLTAEVFWDIDKFSVSMFRRFPNLDVQMGDFGVAGLNEFAGDTLANVDQFHLTLDLMSVISGDKMVIKGITMDGPSIYLIMLENGKANWDIVKVDSAVVAQDVNAGTTEFNLEIKEWEITNGQVVYIDETLPMYMLLRGVDHTGSGDFTQDIFDLVTHTEAQSFNVEFDGIKYLENEKLDAEMTMSINLPEFKYTFKENRLRINEFEMGFDGFLAMPTDDVVMDLTFESKDNKFKSVLSLVPGVYTEGFEDIKASGEMSFNGFVKGVFGADTLNPQMPGFGVNLNVADGMFQYPDLPTPVKNINTDMSVSSPDGDMEKLEVLIKNFHVEMGSNPIDAKAHIKGLTNMEVDANVMAALDLEEITQIFPMEGMVLRGNFNLDGNAKGVYNDNLGKMPAIDAKMSLANGYVKSSEFPEPIKDMRFNATVNNPTGEMRDFKMLVENFHMMLQQEAFQARLALENFEDYTYDLSAKGTIDLEKMTKIYPLEGMTLSGKVIADIDTRGKMSDIEAERYDRLPTSGTASLRNFIYASPDLEHPFNIAEADMNFDPAKMNLTKFNGSFGSTQMQMSGSISNYIAYALKDSATIRGNLNFNSPKVNVNEFMAEEEVAATSPETPLEVIEVPANIDFVLNADIGQVIYDDMVMDDVKGKIIIKDRAVRLQNTTFKTLGGTMALNGEYNTQNPTAPIFEFDMDMQSMVIKQAFATFNVIKQLAPVAEKLDGYFSSTFKLAGNLGQDMLPVFPTLNGGGIIDIDDASVNNVKLLSAITSFTKMSQTDKAELRDILIKAKVKDGRAIFEPFPLVVAGQKMMLGGSQGFDGSIDYLVNMDVDAGAAGAALNNALSQLTGKDATGSSNIKLNLGVAGTYENPKIKLLSSSTEGGSTPKEAIQDAVKDRVNEARDDAEQKAREEVERRRQEAEQRARQEAERIRKEEEDRLQKEADKAKDRLKDKFKIPR